MARLRSFFQREEHQYVPFVAGAVVFGLIVGFPLGITLAHAAAQGSSLGGRWQALAQVHGHLQLMGWVGLFLMGMGFRLVPRFTGVRVRPGALVPLTFALMASGSYCVLSPSPSPMNGRWPPCSLPRRRWRPPAP